MAIHHDAGAEILARLALALLAKLGDGAERRRLGLLATGVGVALGVEHQHVDVLPQTQHMVEPAEADVIGPAIAADEPDRLVHQVIRIPRQLSGARLGAILQQAAQLLDMGPLLGDRQTGVLQPLLQLGRDDIPQTRHQTAYPIAMLIDGEPEAQAKLGVVLEQGVGPGRAAPLGVGGVGGGGQVAAINRRATGGVGNQQPVPVELGQQLDIGGLATAGAGAGVFKQGRDELGGANVDALQLLSRALRQVQEEVVVRLLGLEVVEPRFHVDRLAAWIGAILGRADLDAEVAAGAILRRHLQHILLTAHVAGLHIQRVQGRGGIGQRFFIHHLGADGRVGAGGHAVVALGAEVRLPDRHLLGNVALLPAGGAHRPGAVRREGGNRQTVAKPRQHGGGDGLDEVGGLGGHHGGALVAGRIKHLQRHRDQCLAGGGQGLPVALDQLGALVAIASCDGLLEQLGGLCRRYDGGQLEKRHLHHGIDAAAELALPGNPGGVDGVEAGAFLAQHLLHLLRQSLPDLIGVVGAVEQEDAVGLEPLRHLVHVDELPLVAADEVRLVHQVGRLHRPLVHPQVGDGEAPRLLGVVDEIALGIERGVIAEDLDAVLGRRDGAVAAKAVEERLQLALARIIEDWQGQGEAGDVVEDADGEARPWVVQHQLVEDGLHTGRIELLGGEAVAAADDPRQAGTLAPADRLGQRAHHVQIERLGLGARLLGAIQHCNLAGTLGNDRQQMRG
ncbi:hypothetical protein D3C79_566900 [compost metagenome]